MKFQLISDIHLEFDDSFRITKEKDTDVLVLAGDIGYPKEKHFKDFISDCCSKFKHVIYTTGNHDYYHNEVEEINNYIRSEFKELENFHFLLNDTLEFPEEKIVFWGSTLWSEVPISKRAIVKLKINDFSLINNFSINDYNLLHNQAKKSLQDFISDETWKDFKRIVVTHHAPLVSGTSDPKYEDSPTNCIFATDLSDLVGPPIDTWLFGHTHYRTEFDFNGTTVKTNALGYPGELN